MTYNPYLREFNELRALCKPMGFLGEALEFLQRLSLAQEYSFAIPNEEAITAIAKAGDKKIVEMGAGTGYWAMLLRQAGADVIAYERTPKHNHYKFHKRYI